MRIVVALGGNALLRRGEPMTADNQRANIRIATEQIAKIHPATNWSSPTAMARRSACCRCKAPPTAGRAYPLDVLGAETEGMIGYIIEQELGNLLPFECRSPPC
jgi:carbamate kinase